MMPPFKPQDSNVTSCDVPVLIITVIVFLVIGLTFFFFVKSYIGIRRELRRYPDCNRITPYTVTASHFHDYI